MCRARHAVLLKDFTGQTRRCAEFAAFFFHISQGKNALQKIAFFTTPGIVLYHW
jgi:hypothetical protein